MTRTNKWNCANLNTTQHLRSLLVEMRQSTPTDFYFEIHEQAVLQHRLSSSVVLLFANRINKLDLKAGIRSCSLIRTLRAVGKGKCSFWAINFEKQKFSANCFKSDVSLQVAIFRNISYFYCQSETCWILLQLCDFTIFVFLRRFVLLSNHKKLTIFISVETTPSYKSRNSVFKAAVCGVIALLVI